MSCPLALVSFFPLIFVFVQVAAASPIIQIREEATHQSGISPSVIKLMVIASIIFFSVLLSLYLYRKLKSSAPAHPPALFAAPPMRYIPHRVMVGPVMGSRSPWAPLRRSSSATSRTPLVRESFSSDRTIVMEDIPHPPRAHTRSTKLTRPTAGATPL